MLRAYAFGASHVVQEAIEIDPIGEQLHSWFFKVYEDWLWNEETEENE